ncbi:hypothetical protein AVEN_48458-1 [Araneus ventricosus]|uniref:Uncharacterized protein n=1 Tax=Araneus ventricosus TaxID=182803 RepID=A0A4Y2Q5T6_ARAVE|nr:hypothetical protein AVEN_48458-1 [Araneus ventricosus]
MIRLKITPRALLVKYNSISQRRTPDLPTQPRTSEKQAVAKKTPALWPTQNSPDYERPVHRPPLLLRGGTTSHQRWALSATSPLVYPTGKRDSAYL